MNKLKYFRVLANMTLEKLSDESGVSSGYIAHLEIGSRENPSKEAMEKIAKALGKTVPEVFFTELTVAEAEELESKGHYVTCNDGKATKIESEELANEA